MSLLDHMVRLCLVCWKLLNCLPEFLYHVTFSQGINKVLVPPHPYQYFVFSVFWICLILVVMYLIGVLICNSLIYAHHLFICLFAIFLSYFISYLFTFFAHFLKFRLFNFYCRVLRVLCTFSNSLLSDISFITIISKYGLSSHL